MGSITRPAARLRWQAQLQGFIKRWSRRDFLRNAGKATAALATLPLLSACGDSLPGNIASAATPQMPVELPPPAPGAVEFRHGVASGDPLIDRVILWTRVTPDAGAAQVSVDWLMSVTPNLAAPVQSGSFVTTSARDFTVKIDPAGLTSYTTYYYQFSVKLADGAVVKSPIGRTKTAPRAGDTNRLRMVSASCQSLTFGYFNAHGAIARRTDLDAMLFLGDYIYETAATSPLPGRSHIPAKEIVTLEDYRLRHAQYKTDPDLQAAHRQLAFICVWDDHETTDNSYRTGANNHTEGKEGVWEERMGGAIRAYFEWMPIRDVVPHDSGYDSPDRMGYLPDGSGRIYRTLRYGELADLIMLDTRLAGRARQNGTSTVTPEQTIMGAAQREWFLRELSASGARWKIVGQQMIFAPLKLVPAPEAQGGTYLNDDAWDGYRFDRNAVMRHLGEQAINNVVVLSGDIHAVLALDCPVEPSDPRLYNPVTGAGSLAVELGCNGIANVGVLNEGLMANNPHLKYANLAERGYLLLDITPERVQGEYWFTGAPQVRDATETFQRALTVADGANRLALGTTPSSERADAPALAP